VVARESSNCQQLTTALGCSGPRIARRVSSIQAREGIIGRVSQIRFVDAGTLNIEIQSLVLYISNTPLAEQVTRSDPDGLNFILNIGPCCEGREERRDPSMFHIVVSPANVPAASKESFGYC
jgi:hypothetical protein